MEIDDEEIQVGEGKKVKGRIVKIKGSKNKYRVYINGKPHVFVSDDPESKLQKNLTYIIKQLLEVIKNKKNAKRRASRKAKKETKGEIITTGTSGDVVNFQLRQENDKLNKALTEKQPEKIPEKPTPTKTIERPDLKSLEYYTNKLNLKLIEGQEEMKKLIESDKSKYSDDVKDLIIKQPTAIIKPSDELVKIEKQKGIAVITFSNGKTYYVPEERMREFVDVKKDRDKVKEELTQKENELTKKNREIEEERKKAEETLKKNIYTQDIETLDNSDIQTIAELSLATFGNSYKGASFSPYAGSNKIHQIGKRNKAISKKNYYDKLEPDDKERMIATGKKTNASFVKDLNKRYKSIGAPLLPIPGEAITQQDIQNAIASNPDSTDDQKAEQTANLNAEEEKEDPPADPPKKEDDGEGMGQVANGRDTDKLEEEIENLEGKGRGLFTDEIDKVMQHLGHVYKGTPPIDQIPLLKKDNNKAAFIYNTDVSGGPGKHWIAVLIDHDKPSIEHFDSFGDPPADDFIKYTKPLLKNQPYQLKVNHVIHQRDNTDSCGYHAMNFLYNRLIGGKSYKEASGFKQIEDSKKGEKKAKLFKDFLEKNNFINIVGSRNKED